MEDVYKRQIIGLGGIPRDFIIIFDEVVSSVRTNNKAKSTIYSVVISMRSDNEIK